MVCLTIISNHIGSRSTGSRVYRPMFWNFRQIHVKHLLTNPIEHSSDVRQEKLGLRRRFLDYCRFHSISWKWSLYFVYIFRTGWNSLIKFCSSDHSYSRNILRSLYLKFKTSAHCNYLLLCIIYKFLDMRWILNSYWYTFW